MSSLRQLLADHSPLLLLDACSARVQLGWLKDAEDMHWASSEEEAGVAVFRCLEELRIAPNQAAGFVFCDGPGSILGIRTVAVAIRAWNALSIKPAFSYHGLELLAHSVNRPELTIIADARRDAWHAITTTSRLRRVPTAELSGELAMPEGFRNWTPLPDAVTRIPYVIADVIPRIIDLDLMRSTEAPDAFLHEEPSYVTWTPRIHRAP